MIENEIMTVDYSQVKNKRLFFFSNLLCIDCSYSIPEYNHDNSDLGDFMKSHKVQLQVCLSRVMLITDNIDSENILEHFGAVQNNGECYFVIGHFCDKRKLSSAD